MELQSRRKDIIKNIAIIFLIIMLLLTFFSATILNRSLPEVAAQYAYSGQITTSVRMSGTTTANENYRVIIEEGRVIQSVNVRRGDKVNTGDILFLLEDGDSTELQAALDKLNEEKRTYEKWQLQIAADIEDRERNIRYKIEDLAKIRKKGVVEEISTDEEEAEIKELEKLLATYVLTSAWISYSEADQLMQGAEEAAELAGLTYEEKSEIYHELLKNAPGQQQEQGEAQLLDSERRLEDLNITYTRAKDVYDALCVEYQAALDKREGLQRALNLAKAHTNTNAGNASIAADNVAIYQAEVARLSALPNPTEEDQIALATAQGQLAYYQAMLSNLNSIEANAQAELSKAQAAFDANESAIAQFESQKKSQEQSLEDQERTIKRAQEDYEALKKSIAEQKEQKEQNAIEKEAYDTELKAAQEEMRSAEKIKKEKDKLLSEASTAYNEAKSAYDTAKQNAKKPDESLTQAQLEKLIPQTEDQLYDARERLEELKKQTDSEAYPTEEAYNEAITQKSREIEELRTALDRQKSSNTLEEKTYTEAIARADKEVKRLSESVGASVITAKVPGTINNISVSAGQKVEAQTVLAEIEQQDRGYSVELSMTAEQAKRVAVGQSATILYYWGSTPEAVVTSIKPSQSDPQNTRIVTLSLNGDITAGQNFTFSLGERSASYDTVVPNSAIREDSNGKFVLAVEAKNTPIGNRYTAVRRSVDVIASDETNTAVSGLSGGEFIITTAAQPISAGQQVRLSDQ